MTSADCHQAAYGDRRFAGSAAFTVAVPLLKFSNNAGNYSKDCRGSACYASECFPKFYL